MTPRELLARLAADPWPLVAFYGAVPAAALVLGLVHRRDGGNESPWKYLYSLLVYAACVPGLLGAVVTGYMLFFSRENLLDVNVLVTLVPVVSMVVTLLVAGRHVDFDRLPGFGRLSGLMVTIGLSFVIVLFLQKLNVFVFFGGSVVLLVSAAAFVFALLRWGAYMAFRRHDEPTVRAPKFGE